eukprot:4440156-Pleurochrysis_carterae.AAC.1
MPPFPNSPIPPPKTGAAAGVAGHAKLKIGFSPPPAVAAPAPNRPPLQSAAGAAGNVRHEGDGAGAGAATAGAAPEPAATSPAGAALRSST